MLTTQTCPSCGTEIATDFGYMPWCECGWNVKPAEPIRSPGRVDRLLVAVGVSAGAGLYERIRRNGATDDRIDLSLIVAWAIALLVHVATLGVTILGVFLIVAGGTNVGSLVVGAVLLLLAWVIRPRFASWPTGGVLATPDRMPELFQLIEGVRSALGAPPIDRVYVDRRYNASFDHYGWRRRSGLTIGLPLFSVLVDQERVALLGHEIAHSVNRDPLRGLVLGTAASLLWQLYAVLRPDRLIGRRSGLVDVLAVPFILVQAAVAEGVFLLLRVLIGAVAQRSQRAEYRADILAARVAGRDAEIAMTERLHLGLSVARMTWVGTIEDPIGVIVTKVRGTPPRELERIRRVERLTGSRLDYRHPPTVYRVGVIEALPQATPLVRLGSVASSRIDTELDPIRLVIGKQIVDAYAARIDG